MLLEERGIPSKRSADPPHPSKKADGMIFLAYVSDDFRAKMSF